MQTYFILLKLGLLPNKTSLQRRCGSELIAVRVIVAAEDDRSPPFDRRLSPPPSVLPPSWPLINDNYRRRHRRRRRGAESQMSVALLRLMVSGFSGVDAAAECGRRDGTGDGQ